MYNLSDQLYLPLVHTDRILFTDRIFIFKNVHVCTCMYMYMKKIQIHKLCNFKMQYNKYYVHTTERCRNKCKLFQFLIKFIII
jgi:hypothetical protein